MICNLHDLCHRTSKIFQLDQKASLGISVADEFRCCLMSRCSQVLGLLASYDFSGAHSRLVAAFRASLKS